MAIVIPVFPKLEIPTVDSLRANEKEILTRISRTPRGSYLFVLSPLTLLQDINVALSSDVVAAILKATPLLALVYDRAYQAAKASAHDPAGTFTLKGLFEVTHA
jgi:hypothetical protein